MSWSDKYKRSINCDSPKGFSQRAHCAARKKRAKGESTKSKSPFNEMVEHCGCEDNAVQELETGLKKLDDTSYDSIDKLMRRIMKKHDMTAKQLHNAFVDKHDKTPDTWIKNINEGLFDKLKGRKVIGRTGSGGKITIPTNPKPIAAKYPESPKPQKKSEVKSNSYDDDPWLKSSPASERKFHYRQLKGEETNEGTLHHWFHGSKSSSGKPGWVQADGSPCANEPGETKTPKCFSSGRLKALKRKGKKGEALIKSAVRRKRQKDKGQQQKSGAAAPTNVPTFAKGKKDKNYIKAEPGIKEAMELNEAQQDRPGKGSGKKDACYNKVKSRYRVWPSAYASGALVKCRKVGAQNWGTKSESMEMERFCPKCNKNEKRNECKYGERYWDMFSLPMKIGRKYDANSPHPGNFPENFSYGSGEGKGMKKEKKYTLANIEKQVKKLKEASFDIDPEALKKQQKREKIRALITKGVGGEKEVAARKLGSTTELPKIRKEETLDEKCWPGYKKKGMKTMFGKKYPNCVKTESVTIEDADGNTFAEFIDIIGPNQIEPIVNNGCWKGHKQVDEAKGHGGSPGQEYIDPMKGKKFSPAPKDLRKTISFGTRGSVGQDPKNSPGNTNSATSESKKTFGQFMQIVENLEKPATKDEKRKISLMQKLERLKAAAKAPSIVSDVAIKEEVDLEESTPAWQRKAGKNPEGGLNKKGIASYRREHPGSHLSLAVTTKPSKLKKGSKSAKRRKSFCSRMKGMKAKLTSAKTAHDPNSRINKSLRKWNC